MSEFARPERLDAIGVGERTIEIAAGDAERAALAGRFGLIAIARLDAVLTVARGPAGIVVRGRVTADVTQACSVTDEPLETGIDEPVALVFVEKLGHDQEVELREDTLDTVEIEGDAIDLGEVAAETMALALDPFPRGPDAAATLKRAGVLSEEEAKPATALAGLKARLEGR